MEFAKKTAVSERRSGDPEWRADALAKSRHSRLLDQIRRPGQTFDPRQASLVCSQICRGALGDLAPALLLLPRDERRRAQVLAAFCMTLFDFAGQPGLEGDRLAEINRWEFGCEEALGGRPPAQPVFHLLASEQRRRPWPAEAIDQLFALARRRATGRIDGWPAEVARAGLLALTRERPTDRAVELAGGLLRLQALRRSAASGEKLSGLPPAATFDRALTDAPGPWGNALAFLRLAGASLQKQAARAGTARDARIGLVRRLALLLRARLGN